MIPTPKESRVQNYWPHINKVIDPETGIGLVDMGLIYNIEIKEGLATITMTLTSLACPLGPQIIEMVEQNMGQYPGVDKVKVDLVWDPAWNQEMIDADIRTLLWGI